MPLTLKRVTAVILFVIGLSVLLGLGIWQKSRGQEKERIHQLITSREAGTIPDISHRPESWETIQYSPVALKGHWLTGKTFLLANRFYQHEAGYEVYGLFQLTDDSSVLLINRGWIPLTHASHLTIRDTTQASLNGTLYKPGKGFTLGPATTDPSASPIELQYLDVNLIGHIVQHPVEPATLVLEPGNPNSFQYNWQPIVMNPERHYAYALQWFGLAAVWLVFGIIWLFQLGKNDNINHEN